MSSMGATATSERQSGYVSGVLISLILVSVALTSVVAFGIWAFMGRQDYKNASDAKVDAAVVEAKQATRADDAIRYAEEAKNPLKTHVGPVAFGSVTVQYPKSWSGYVEEGGSTSHPVNDYFHPDVVPAINGDTPFALRVEVVQQSYDKVLASYKGIVQNKRASAGAYSLPKVPSVVGTRIDGELLNKKQGSMVILPLRNMTLEISTEAAQYGSDFNNLILPNVSFSP